MSSFLNGSYGLSLIMIIIIIRGFLFPLSMSQHKNQLKTKKIQPEIKKIKEKYANKKDPADKQKEMQETMELYKKHDIKIFSSGCLPLLIQMPIFFTLFYACTRTPEINTHDFLWFNLGSTDPYYILPVLAGIITYFQFKISMADSQMNNNMPAINNDNDQINKMMQNYLNSMRYIIPAIVLITGLTFPSVVSFYLVISGLFGLLQTIFLKKIFK